MVLLVILLVLLSIQLRRQPNLTTIQHNLKTDTPKEIEINKKILLYLWIQMYLLYSYNVIFIVIIWLKNYMIKHTISDSTFNYLMSQLTLLAIHLLLIITTYSYWLYFTITVHLNYNRSHKNIIDDKATKLDARTNKVPYKSRLKMRASKKRRRILEIKKL